jgi:hypothetical protein
VHKKADRLFTAIAVNGQNVKGTVEWYAIWAIESLPRQKHTQNKMPIRSSDPTIYNNRDLAFLNNNADTAPNIHQDTKRSWKSQNICSRQRETKMIGYLIYSIRMSLS